MSTHISFIRFLWRGCIPQTKIFRRPCGGWKRWFMWCSGRRHSDGAGRQGLHGCADPNWQARGHREPVTGDPSTIKRTRGILATRIHFHFIHKIQLLFVRIWKTNQNDLSLETETRKIFLGWVMDFHKMYLTRFDFFSRRAWLFHEAARAPVLIFALWCNFTPPWLRYPWVLAGKMEGRNGKQMSKNRVHPPWK